MGEARDAPPVECASAPIARAADGLPLPLTPVFAPKRIAAAAALPAGAPLRLREDAQQTLPRSDRGCVTLFTRRRSRVPAVVLIRILAEQACRRLLQPGVRQVPSAFPRGWCMTGGWLMRICYIGRSPLWKATMDSRGRAGIQIHGVFQGEAKQIPASTTPMRPQQLVQSHWRFALSIPRERASRLRTRGFKAGASNGWVRIRDFG